MKTEINIRRHPDLSNTVASGNYKGHIKKIASVMFMLLFVFCHARSQDIEDAIRYSDYRLRGTARAASMGNAFGALGGDFTSASINPAGIGLYRSNELALTLKYGDTNIEGTFLGNSVSAARTRLSVPHLGYVATFDTGYNPGSALVSINIGLGYNRMNDFNERRRVLGTNATSSFLDQLTYNANEIGNSDNFGGFEAMAWETFLINFDEDEGEFFNDIADAGHGQSQRRSMTHKGSIEEYLFSVAANINHKWYLGMTFGIHDLYFRQVVSHSEFDSPSQFFDNFTLDSYLRTTGTGYNIKLGAIYRPIDPLRLGFALHTPTWYQLRDFFYDDLFARVVNDEGQWVDAPYESDAFRYDYNLQTPFRAVFSAAWTFGQSGLVSADYEIVNYGSARLGNGSDGWEFDPQNDVIRESLRTVGNLRLGGEYRVSPAVSLRAGFEYLPGIYGSDFLNSDTHTFSYSAGAGWRYKGFFADVAYKRTTQSDLYLQLYEVPDNLEAPLAKFNSTLNDIMLTIGFRF